MATPSAKLTLPVSDRDHAQGPATALVTLLEYGNYECPHCGKAYPIVEELRRQFGDRKRAAQGRFWGMHQILLMHQSALETSHLVRYAERLGLDAARIARELAAHTFQGRVREDFMSGVRSGVNGTPIFFINGMRHDGRVDSSSLSEAMEDAANSPASLPHGDPSL
jgi:protein-disulfide isomerase